MEIAKIFKLLTPQHAASADVKQLLTNLQPDQILKATVLSDNIDNNLKLRIGRHEVIAHTGLKANIGQQLQLQVTKSGSLPEMRLLQGARVDAPQVPALKAALPRQIPLEQLFQTLNTVNLDPVVGRLPEIQQVIRKLLARAATVSSLQSGANLADGIRHSGLFAETHLLTERGRLHTDLKINLLRLMAHVQSYLPSLQQQAGPNAGSSRHRGKQIQEAGRHGPLDQQQRGILQQLQHQIEGALARIQVNQLASLSDATAGQQVWQIDLPIRQDIDRSGAIHIRIQKNPSSHPDETDASWTVNLCFDLDPLGPITTRLSLSGHGIASQFWAEHAATRSLLTRELPRLENAFANAGLRVTGLRVHQAPPPDPPPFRIPDRLVDETV